MVELVDEIVTVAAGVATDEAATEFSLGDLIRAVVDRFARRTGRRSTIVGRRVAGARPAVRHRAGGVQPARQRRQVRCFRRSRSRSRVDAGDGRRAAITDPAFRRRARRRLRALPPCHDGAVDARIRPRPRHRPRRGRSQRRLGVRGEREAAAPSSASACRWPADGRSLASACGGLESRAGPAGSSRAARLAFTSSS